MCTYVCFLAIYLILWVTIQYYCFFILCLGYWKLFQLSHLHFWYTLIFLLFKISSLFSGSTKDTYLILNLPWLSSKISHFSKELICFFGKWHVKTKNLGTGFAYCYWCYCFWSYSKETARKYMYVCIETHMDTHTYN